MFKLNYLYAGETPFVNMFKLEEKTALINQDNICYISGLHKWFEDEFIANYAIVSMVNGDKFYISEDEYIFFLKKF